MVILLLDMRLCKIIIKLLKHSSWSFFFKLQCSRIRQCWTGYSSVGGNTTGYGNVGIGAYTLQNNKLGDFNVAIGHGAGYFAKRNQNNTLYIGSHNVDADYICANPTGSGLTPLMFGDMYDNRLGINTGTS